jgi:class 3 adenylate cyclase
MALQKTLLTRAVIPTASVDIDFGLANYPPPGWHLGPRMDIGAWLRSLGLERYEAAFRDNEIDETVLRSLTPEDLKDLGVGIVGHRRKILDAIGALLVDESTKASTATTVPKAEVVAEDRAERRQVTVMFADLVGSTALSARMDPEDLREVISSYQKCVAETVGRFGGFVAKYMGDGVLIYFGYPQAHEDDAERAVSSALELIAAVGALKSPSPLQTRVGIATGLVVVGDLVGSGEAQERGIVGETPNLAARLQGIAEPDTAILSEGTRRLIGKLFDLKDLGLQDLKGIARGVRAWKASPASRTRGCATFVHRNIPIARFIRSSAKRSAPPASPTTIRRDKNSTSSTRYSRKRRRRRTTPHSSLTCCLCRTTDVIPRPS